MKSTTARSPLSKRGPMAAAADDRFFRNMVTNMRNGVLAKLLADRPQLRWLMLHNIDTVGADLDPALLGWHIQSGAALTFEMINRRLEDRGGDRIEPFLRRLTAPDAPPAPAALDQLTVDYMKTTADQVSVYTLARLRAEGFRPVWHQRIPPNDGGISLGQVAAVAWNLA